MCESLRLFALRQGTGAKAWLRHWVSTVVKQILIKRAEAR
jgi:hypothetical protein